MAWTRGGLGNTNSPPKLLLIIRTMKRYAKALVGRATKRARTVIVSAVKSRAKKFARNAGRRLRARASNTKAARAFGSLVGKLGMDNNIRVSGVGSVLSNFQNNVELTNIAQGTGTTQREGQRILLKGIHVNIMFTNITSNKMYLNFCMLSPKSTGGEIATGNFFRQNQGATNVGFNDGSLTALAKHTRPVNADSYVIHFHKRWILGTAATTTSSNYDNTTRSNKAYKFYYKLNQMVAYSDKGPPTGVTADNRIFVVYWFNNVGSGLPLSGTNSLTIEQDFRVIYGGE